MPKLNAKVEGKGNGIKTVIVNISDISKALNRKPIYVTKFFGCELGAQIHVDDKNERYIVNGAHDAAKLQELLDGFIKKFVLCQGCGNPETTMRVNKKSATVGTVCKACGNQGQLDVSHRLTQFIVKNPPQPDSSSQTKAKKSKKVKNGERNSDEDHDVSITGDDSCRRSPTNATDADEDWVEDTTEEAQLQRMNELSAMAKSLALSLDVEKSESERADVLYKHVLQLVSSGEVISGRQVKQQADDLELGPRAILVVAEALLSNRETILADIKKYTSVLLAFTRVGEEQQSSQHYMLGAMTKLVERFDLLPKACHILKCLYDSDVVEEDAIFSWNAKGPSKEFVSRDLSAKILAQCAPMVKWLQSAEEESDEESGSEEASESKPRVNSEPLGNQFGDAVTQDSKEQDSSDGEIDIDAI